MRMPAVAMDDRLGQAGGARREQHAQWMVERQLVELEWPVAVEQRRPARSASTPSDLLVDRVPPVLHLDDVLAPTAGAATMLTTWVRRST